MSKTFKEIVNIIESKGMIYFKNNFEELKNFIIKLRPELNGIKSSANQRYLFYSLLELEGSIRDADLYKSIDNGIKDAESKFFDYLEIVRN
ncbi:hypothetical protein JW813_07540 [Clostridium botulinum]|uniref:hypothetical protein n=1 Tax=Clostridium botulinum TaxID=1491 RepID=UPI0013F9046D|nr:hypothetical protein [Clostridium botulinum]MBN1058571.1 hypothetical protein [Clostridium botulinum]MBN1071532.1 hypothetical protein [Clostridium botulinum]NFF80362.1 hypothetical protein [Clostridium botulinum]UZP04852.1 hypothetical protein JW813_07540 [Clostridium botulinum]UZP08263.1 hypothetical protein JYA71_07810 [Clostridium botulinum]